MTSRKGRVSVHVELPEETREALKEADEPMWKVLHNSVKTNLGLGDVETEQALQNRVNRLVQREENVQSEIEDREDELETILADKKAAQAQLDAYLKERDSIETIQRRVLEAVAGTSMSVYSQISDLRDLAEQEYGRATDENIEKAIVDLEDRCDELSVDVADVQFDEMTRGNTVDDTEPVLASVGDSDD